MEPKRDTQWVVEEVRGVVVVVGRVKETGGREWELLLAFGTAPRSNKKTEDTKLCNHIYCGHQFLFLYHHHTHPAIPRRFSMIICLHQWA